MFKENKEFWLYLLGIIIMFFLLFFGIRTYMESTGITADYNSKSPLLLITQTTTTPKVVSFTDEVSSSSIPEPTVKKEEFQLDPNLDYYATVKTNKGEFVVELFEKNAPKTVANFISLSTKGYYDMTSFHRLITDVLLQGGSRRTLDNDSANDKFGNPGYTIFDEINWSSLDYSDTLKQSLTQEGYVSTSLIASKEIDRYRLAMAGAGPNTGGSQFFIVLGTKDKPAVDALRGRYTVFGEIISNKEVVDSINKIETDIQNEYRPKEAITIDSITIYTKKLQD